MFSKASAIRESGVTYRCDVKGQRASFTVRAQSCLTLDEQIWQFEMQGASHRLTRLRLLFAQEKTFSWLGHWTTVIALQTGKHTRNKQTRFMLAWNMCGLFERAWLSFIPLKQQSGYLPSAWWTVGATGLCNTLSRFSGSVGADLQMKQASVPSAGIEL